MGERTDEIDEVRRGVNPIAEIGDIDMAGAVYVGMVPLDDHVASRGEEDGGWGAGVRLEKPDDGRDVVDDAAIDDGNGALDLEKLRRSAVVVGEGGGLRRQGGEGLRQRDQVLPDQPLHILRIGQRVGPPLRQRAAQELRPVLPIRHRRGRSLHHPELCKP